MLNIDGLKGVFHCDDISLKNIIDVHSNLITKFVIIEGCCDYFDPKNGFHCIQAQKAQQATINLFALVSCGKAIADDLTEICRMLFCEELKKQNVKMSPWRLHFDIIIKKFPDTPLSLVVNQHGLHSKAVETTNFYPKVKKLRDTLIHREINKTFSTTANDFYVSESFTSTGKQMKGKDYAIEVFNLMKAITNDINNCLLQNGKNSILV